MKKRYTLKDIFGDVDETSMCTLKDFLPMMEQERNDLDALIQLVKENSTESFLVPMLPFMKDVNDPYIIPPEKRFLKLVQRIADYRRILYTDTEPISVCHVTDKGRDLILSKCNMSKKDRETCLKRAKEIIKQEERS